MIIGNVPHDTVTATGIHRTPSVSPSARTGWLAVEAKLKLPSQGDEVNASKETAAAQVLTAMEVGCEGQVADHRGTVVREPGQPVQAVWAVENTPVRVQLVAAID